MCGILVYKNSGNNFYIQKIGHDFDAFENFRINESELGLTNFDLGLTHYTYKPEWQGASFFFKESAKDILELLDKTTRSRPYSSRNIENSFNV